MNHFAGVNDGFSNLGAESTCEINGLSGHRGARTRGRFAFFFYRGETEFNRYAEIRSTDGSYTAVIDVGHPSSPYGSHKIDLTIIDSSNHALIHERYTLSNDGAKVDSGNITARWVKPDHFEICLRGEEQANVKVSVRVSSKEVARATMGC